MERIDYSVIDGCLESKQQIVETAQRQWIKGEKGVIQDDTCIGS